MSTKQASFRVSKADALIIGRIVDRGLVMAEQAGRKDVAADRMSAHMDITACHANGNPLDLEKLLKADDFNFAHDFFGINRHINRVTGEMMDCFVPRCTRHETVKG